MNKTVLIDRIKDEIGDKKVVAAVFYTFNFQPTFFENYVMPILVRNDATAFGDEKIRNTILWRYLYKENKIPPITVYCDYYAKDNSEAPTLGYHIECIRIPAKKGKITNFHPKNSFILLENGKSFELLFITGSGNLTSTGWCDNVECFTTEILKRKLTYPRTVKTENLQDFINACSSVADTKVLSPAENKVYDFLKYRDGISNFFNSMEMSFGDFLDNRVRVKWNEIVEVEVVSPYFSKDLECISYFEKRNIKVIKCLLPTFKNDEVMLDEDLFNAISKTSVKWCNWKIAKEDEKKSNLHREPRNQHAKIYRLYTSTYCITIVGSVNFTTPAWSKCIIKLASANVETAMFYKEKTKERLLEEINNLDSSTFRFISKDSLEDNESGNKFNRSAPEITFTIDWRAETLEYEASIKATPCFFSEILGNADLLHGKHIIELDYKHLHIFSKKALIQIQTKSEEKYSYYANQLNIQSKPLGFKIDANVILEYWAFLGKPFQQDKITIKIALALTDASGIVDITKYKQPLLNEMAAHFAGLSRLENYLFDTAIKTQRDADDQKKKLQYYLLSSNVDTLLFYFNNIQERLNDGTIQNSFYYMIGKILIHSFYEKALQLKNYQGISIADVKSFKSSLKAQKQKFEKEIESIIQNVEGLKEKEVWVTKQLT